MARGMTRHISSSPASPSPSPVSPRSTTSDKENQTTTPLTSTRKRKESGSNNTNTRRGNLPYTTSSTAAMPHDPELVATSSTSASKRRRVGPEANSQRPALSSMMASGTPTQQRSAAMRDSRFYYDPDQDLKERRANRSNLRQLEKELKEFGDEYLQADSSGITDTILKADACYRNVKQTADAIIDSRILVNAADLGYKKTAQLALGDTSTGIDVDEFVAKCISFMRRGGPATERLSGTTPQRRRRTQQNRPVDSDDEDADNDTDNLNWEILGRRACIPYNARPSVSSFLLGPLSTQKKIRAQTQRRAPQGRVNPEDAVRPDQLREEDLDKQDEQNLTVLCTRIRHILKETQEKRTADFEAAAEDLPESEDEDEAVANLMKEHGIADNGGIPLFEFCVNPKSFGQTVENLFYVSFLIRDGSVGLSVDGRGLPTLLYQERLTAEETRSRGIQQKQAVFSIDFETWEDLIRTFEITKPVIPHRKAEKHDDGRVGWY